MRNGLLIIIFLLLSMNLGARAALSLEDLTQIGMDNLIERYDWESGGWGDVGQEWWHEAIGLKLIIYNMNLTQDFSNFDLILNSFAKLLKINAKFKNNFFDDEQWWVLTWLEAYEFAILNNIKIDEDDKFLNISKNIYANLAKNWGQNSFKQGLVWEKNGDQINAIENILYVLVGFKLYKLTQNNSYLLNSQKALVFFQANFIDQKTGLVIDGPINLPHKKIFWSYTAGVYLESLSCDCALSPDKNSNSCDKFMGLLDNYMKYFSVNGVCSEMYYKLDHDQEEFKGIFINSLVRSAGNLKFLSQEKYDSICRNIENFLQCQKEIILSTDPNLDMLIPAHWSPQKSPTRNFITQISGMSVFVGLLSFIGSKSSL